MKRFVFCFLLLASCNDFLDANLDKSLIAEDRIFSNDVTATSAVIGMYNSIAYSSRLSGLPNGMAALTGLSSGELYNYPQDTDLRSFQLFQVSSESSSISAFWNFMYNLIYQANAILEGLQNSHTISVGVSNQLEGESRFVRAFTYFYLANLFGDVPLVIGTDYRKNKLLSRSSVDEVYALIESDLLAAQSLLSADYVTADKARPNRATASALLARMYLYRKEYEKAEIQATSIIDSKSYALNSVDEIGQTFLKDSPETIWQIMPVDPSRNTAEAFYFIIVSAPPSFNIMTDALHAHFEPGDARLSTWIKSYTNNGNTYYFPYKYKQTSKNSSSPFVEYSVVFRLSEIYLIRSESRVHLNDLSGGMSDLNVIRNRANLPDIDASDQSGLLLSIERERQSELFAEYGHRWLDLKRTGRTVEVLGNGITEDDLLYPVPAIEFKQNPNLGLQNSGY